MANDLQALSGKRIDLVEDGQLKNFAVSCVENEKGLIYERKAKVPFSGKEGHPATLHTSSSLQQSFFNSFLMIC